jgi:hypothetical protein
MSPCSIDPFLGIALPMKPAIELSNRALLSCDPASPQGLSARLHSSEAIADGDDAGVARVDRSDRG